MSLYAGSGSFLPDNGIKIFFAIVKTGSASFSRDSRIEKETVPYLLCFFRAVPLISTDSAFTGRTAGQKEQNNIK